MLSTFDRYLVLPSALLLILALAPAVHAEPTSSAALVEACEGFGPQTPRDIDSAHGENPRVFNLGPNAAQMNLCNIHFHKNAEHKATDYNVWAGAGDDKGIGGGYKCSGELSEAESAAYSGNVCNGLQVGDTIEVHWVHSSCDIAPGPTLGACLDNDRCMNPSLRVEAQVFVLVNDDSALDFADFAHDGYKADGYYQAKAFPTNSGAPVQFTGSTTGPSYNEKCSPLQVSWSVRPLCAKLNIASLDKWCQGNVFKEDHAHGVRELVTDPRLLSRID